MYKREHIGYDGIPYYEYYYTLKDLMSLVGGDTKLFSSTSLATIVNNYFSNLVGEGYYKNGAYADKVWQRILSKYETNFIYVSPFELNTTTYLDQTFNGFKKIITKMEETSFKFDKLLAKIYNANTDLFGAIKSKIKSDGTSKFNDTPQDTITSLEDDKFLSNLTKNENETTNETDGINIVERIEQYLVKYRNILDTWCYEFNELFIESANIE